MAKIEFYVDEVKERDFTIDAVELLSAPFEHANIYCLNYFPGILGPIAKRTIRSSVQALSKNQFYKKLPLISGSLKLPSSSDSIIVLSRGMLPYNPSCKLYYFYAPYWESDDYRDFYQTQNWFIKKWLDLYRNKTILSLQKNQKKVVLSNKLLATKYNLNESAIVYPFFKSEDFPRVDLVVERKAVTLYLKGASLEEKTMLAQCLANSALEHSFYIFGDEDDRSYFDKIDTINNLRFESQFCSATLQAAFLQSLFFFQFPNSEELPFALGALASGAYVAHRNSALLMEVFPEGLLLLCHDIPDIFHMLQQWDKKLALLDIAEARRFALRFSERNFKEKLLALINAQKTK